MASEEVLENPVLRVGSRVDTHGTFSQYDENVGDRHRAATDEG